MATREKARRRLTRTQARAARRARRERRRRIIRYAAITGVSIFAFLFIVALFLPSIPFAAGIGFFGREAPTGPGQRMPDQGQAHVTPGAGHPPYNSVPATSGWHYGQPLGPVRWGVYDEFVEDEALLHNLEHGGVGVHYDCPEGCPELVEKLKDIVDDFDKVVMSPYPNMGSRIALTAWTFIDKFDEFDEERIRAFIRAHLSSPNAPEPFAR